ncbi:MAG: glycosyltransferase family 39 protein [Acidimicrobiia bacterium]|nr:glycosyltransferase family 39 protein [Acidimicrobiia bacterium]
MARFATVRAMPGPSRKFRWWLAAVTVAGFVLRVLYIRFERSGTGLEAAAGVVGGDAFFYHKGAQLLPHHGFISPEVFLGEGRVMPAAEHPPLYLLWLAIPSALNVTSPLAHMLWSALIGTATIVTVGLLGREVAGERTGLIAAGLAAVYPNIWAPDGFLVSETMAIFTVTLTLLLAYRYVREPGTGRAVLLGTAAALAALSRAEALLLFALVVLPVIWRVREEPIKLRLRRLVAAALLPILLIGSWVGFNISRFENPVFLSSGFDVTLLSSTCDDTYYGRFTGYWSIFCVAEVRDAEVTPDMDQSETAVIYRRAATEYLGDNLGRLPVVVLARWGRITGLWNPGQQVKLDQFPEGREKWVAWSALLTWYPLALLAIGGAIALRRRRDAPLFPLLAPPIGVMIAITITFATTRYRATAETAIVVLAAVAVDTLLRRREA